MTKLNTRSPCGWEWGRGGEGGEVYYYSSVYSLSVILGTNKIPGLVVLSGFTVPCGEGLGGWTLNKLHPGT